MTVIIYNSGKNGYFKLNLTTMEYTIIYPTPTKAEDSKKYYFRPSSVDRFCEDHLSISGIPAETYLKTNHPELFI